jgi:oligoribonuclease (3'-5' exoribonuclease)
MHQRKAKIFLLEQELQSYTVSGHEIMLFQSQEAQHNLLFIKNFNRKRRAFVLKQNCILQETKFMQKIAPKGENLVRLVNHYQSITTISFKKSITEHLRK